MKKIILAVIIAISSLSATAQEANELKTMDEFFDFYYQKECCYQMILNSPWMIKKTLREPMDMNIDSLKIISFEKCDEYIIKAWEQAVEITEKNYTKVPNIEHEESDHKFKAYIKYTNRTPDNEMVMHVKKESILLIAQGDFSSKDVQEYVSEVLND